MEEAKVFKKAKTAYQVIQTKKRGEELSYGDVKIFVDGYVSGTITDAQMAAFMMAVNFQDMTKDETLALTDSMAKSGRVIDTTTIPDLLDKHSTGGVGDKTTFLVAAMLNAAGYNVGMMSGRGLGHTGGTLDKLESISGFRSEFDEEEYLSTLEENGIAIISQTDDIAPADKKMYALRNETATIDSIPLIAASIMSKKIASGTRNIVLDVKWGDGAFMKERADAEKLAEVMEEIGRGHGMKTAAVVSPMNDVLGWAVGNAIEIRECLDIMDGIEDPRSQDLIDLSVGLSAILANLVDAETSCEDLSDKLRKTLSNGTAKASFIKFLAAQGVDISNGIPLVEYSPKADVIASSNGFIEAVDVEKIGLVLARLGANRVRAGEPVHHDVGLDVKVHIGDEVSSGDVVATLCWGKISESRLNSDTVEHAVAELLSCWKLS